MTVDHVKFNRVNSITLNGRMYSVDMDFIGNESDRKLTIVRVHRIRKRWRKWLVFESVEEGAIFLAIQRAIKRTERSKVNFENSTRRSSLFERNHRSRIQSGLLSSGNQTQVRFGRNIAMLITKLGLAI